MKKIFYSILIMLMLISGIVFASDESYETEVKILNGYLDAILYVGYAAALFGLMFGAIKYITSGAKERANIKGMLIKYVIGVGFILLSLTIVKTVAEVAGNENANDVVDKGIEIINKTK